MDEQLYLDRIEMLTTIYHGCCCENKVGCGDGTFKSQI